MKNLFSAVSVLFTNPLCFAVTYYIAKHDNSFYLTFNFNLSVCYLCVFVPIDMFSIGLPFHFAYFSPVANLSNRQTSSLSLTQNKQNFFAVPINAHHKPRWLFHLFVQYSPPQSLVHSSWAIDFENFPCQHTSLISFSKTMLHYKWLKKINPYLPKSATSSAIS